MLWTVDRRLWTSFLMRCYLVRHAQTAWNYENRIQGHSDQPLSLAGLDQAKRLGGYFAGRTIAAVYTSHLLRSVQTAQAIARQTGKEPSVDPMLAEMHLGEWEGLTPEEVNSRYGGAYQRWRVAPSEVSIPASEPLKEFRRRVEEVVERILAVRHGEGDIVIVSHGGVIAALLAAWMQAEYDQLLRRLVLDNAGVSAIDYRMMPPCILWVNATHHLSNHTPATLIPPA